MTNLVGRPRNSRGERRREQLVDAGVTLLAEAGWAAVTTRAVAERAGANLGLVHYHFGNRSALRLAIARRAMDAVIEPVLVGVLTAEDERSALEAVRLALSETTGNERAIRLTTEMITESFRDPALGELTREQLGDAREQLAERLERFRPDWTPGRRLGVACLIAALLDGLLLHRMLDPAQPIEPALTALADLMRLKE